MSRNFQHHLSGEAPLENRQAENGQACPRSHQQPCHPPNQTRPTPDGHPHLPTGGQIPFRQLHLLLSICEGAPRYDSAGISRAAKERGTVGKQSAKPTSTLAANRNRHKSTAEIKICR